MSGAAPAAIAAISIAYLQATGRLTDLLDAFFAHLAVPEQVCLCSLLLSALCLVSSISGFVHEAKAGAAEGGGGGGHDHEETDIYAGYPFEAMHFADSPGGRFRAMFPALRDEMEQVLATGSIEDGDDDGRRIGA